MLTSEVLNKAADLIEERGWRPGGGWRGTAEKGALCLEGGIQAAMGVEVGPGYRCPAYDAVAAYIDSAALWIWNDRLPYPWPINPDADPAAGRRYPGGSRKAALLLAGERVVATLRATALIEAAKENADTEPELVEEAPAEVPC
jgi:hypothetical protein